MKARFAITLLTLLALVLGGAGPAAAQGRSFSVPLAACLIDAIGELRQADLGRLPANAREAILTGEDLDDTTARIDCANSATQTTAELTCEAFLPGRAAMNTNIKQFLNPCLIPVGQCMENPADRTFVTANADSNSLMVQNQTTNVCADHFALGQSCFLLSLRCLANTRN